MNIFLRDIQLCHKILKYLECRDIVLLSITEREIYSLINNDKTLWFWLYQNKCGNLENLVACNDDDITWREKCIRRNAADCWILNVVDTKTFTKIFLPDISKICKFSIQKDNQRGLTIVNCVFSRYGINSYQEIVFDYENKTHYITPASCLSDVIDFDKYSQGLHELNLYALSNNEILTQSTEYFPLTSKVSPNFIIKEMIFESKTSSDMLKSGQLGNYPSLLDLQNSTASSLYFGKHIHICKIKQVCQSYFLDEDGQVFQTIDTSLVRKVDFYNKSLIVRKLFSGYHYGYKFILALDIDDNIWKIITNRAEKILYLRLKSPIITLMPFGDHLFLLDSDGTVWLIESVSNNSFVRQKINFLPNTKILQTIIVKSYTNGLMFFALDRQGYVWQINRNGTTFILETFYKACYIHPMENHFILFGQRQTTTQENKIAV